MSRFRTLTLPLLLLSVAALVGCSVEEVLDDVGREAKNSIKQAARKSLSKRDSHLQTPTSQQPEYQQPAGQRAAGRATANDSITIASFNIQVFGSSKAKKPEVMDILANIIRRYDVVAIQELRTKDKSIVPRFVDLINRDGGRYDSIVGPRLGRTISKEQYVFIYDTDRIEALPNSIYTVADPQDLLHREPLVATFRVRGVPSHEAFQFKLVNIHTDPDETKTELDALGDVFMNVLEDGSGEDDVIVVGDLNVNYRKLGKLGRLQDMAWAISDQMTNTRLTKSYDNLVFNNRATVEFRGHAGVLNLMDGFGLSKAEALKVSDHMPVWAEFSVREGGQIGPVATQPASAVR